MFTFNNEVGADVPIPILPEEEIRIRSSPLVKKRRGIYVVVPRLDDDVAFEFPARLQKGEVFCERSEVQINSSEEMTNKKRFIKQGFICVKQLAGHNQYYFLAVSGEQMINRNCGVLIGI
jgi:hypothetical protein